MESCRRIKPNPEDVNPILLKAGTASIQIRQSLGRLLMRPHIRFKDLQAIPDVNHLLSSLEDLRADVVEQVEIEIKYEGYFQRQREQVERFKRLESKKIPESIKYLEIPALSKEAREKLNRIRPLSLGQASRISGVSPADISILAILITKES
jgi:tRNA uridine 5-carboxymethylaminomethyl modification enzyme